MLTARPAAWLTWEALSVGVRWRPPLSVVVVTQLVTRFPRACSGAARQQVAIGYAHGSGGGERVTSPPAQIMINPGAWSTPGPQRSDPLLRRRCGPHAVGCTRPTGTRAPGTPRSDALGPGLGRRRGRGRSRSAQTTRSPSQDPARARWHIFPGTSTMTGAPCSWT